MFSPTVLAIASLLSRVVHRHQLWCRFRRTAPYTPIACVRNIVSLLSRYICILYVLFHNQPRIISSLLAFTRLLLLSPGPWFFPRGTPYWHVVSASETDYPNARFP
ncbi:hypothetical protein F5141DRAFT_609923 [Pisolithus sp. B1]|nr:hypothetical protein F5141DRAFT_609923 [Pisolithus sp. B1]